MELASRLRLANVMQMSPEDTGLVTAVLAVPMTGTAQTATHNAAK